VSNRSTLGFVCEGTCELDLKVEHSAQANKLFHAPKRRRLEMAQGVENSYRHLTMLATL
jgi:hypothetical protein